MGGWVGGWVHLGAGDEEMPSGGGALRTRRVGEHLCRQQQLQRMLLGLHADVGGLHLGVHLVRVRVRVRVRVTSSSSSVCAPRPSRGSGAARRRRSTCSRRPPRSRRATWRCFICSRRAVVAGRSRSLALRAGSPMRSPGPGACVFALAVLLPVLRLAHLARVLHAHLVRVSVRVSVRVRVSPASASPRGISV